MSLASELLIALPRKELQTLAKQHGIRANGSNLAILQELLKVAEKEEQSTSAADEVPASATQNKIPAGSVFKVPPLVLHQEQTDAVLKDQALLAAPSSGVPGRASRKSSIPQDLNSSMAALSVSSRQTRQESASVSTSGNVMLSVPKLSPEERPFGMAHYLESLQHKTGTVHTAQQADPYVGIMLRGRRGVGKKLLTKVFAGSIGAGYLQLDFQSLVATGDPSAAGDKFREAYTAVQAQECGTTVLVLDHVEALSSGGDNAAAAAMARRLKADVSMAMMKVKKHFFDAARAAAASSKHSTRSTPRGGPSHQSQSSPAKVIVIAILHGDDTVQPERMLLSTLLDTSAQRGDRNVPLSPSASDYCNQIMKVSSPDYDRRDMYWYHLMTAAEAELTGPEMETISREWTHGCSMADLATLAHVAGQAAASRAAHGPRGSVADKHYTNIHMCDVETALHNLMQS